jgi:hypothetical protein
MVPCDGTEDFSLRTATQRDRKVISVTRCYRLIVNHRSVCSFTSTPETRALPSAGITWPQRSYGPLRLPGWPSSFDDVEGATFAIPGSPPITQITFPACRAHYPGGPNRCLSVASLSARPSPVNGRVGIHNFTLSESAMRITSASGCPAPSAYAYSYVTTSPFRGTIVPSSLNTRNTSRSKTAYRLVLIGCSVTSSRCDGRWKAGEPNSCPQRRQR